MKYTISIKADNAAFEDAPGVEAARILRKLADKLESGDAYDDMPLMDYNGSRVGKLEIDPE